MSDLDALAARLKADYEGCFGCGSRNPIGLRLSGFALEGDAVTAAFEPRPDYRGFGGILHGGVLAAALDEMCAWTAMLTERVLVVTGRLELRFRRPAPLDGPYLLRGRVRERRGRRLLLSSEAVHADVVVAEAEGLFLVSEEL